ncbi:MAG: very short patch repair endonuclease [Bryobacteraceae bacterium]|jgi:DNA mismatch endonuclease (patch repair protein)
MVDHVLPAKRSLIMAAVRSEDTGPEVAVRRIVYRLGYRYRLHVRSLPGHPDLVLPPLRKVIFVHGCFWHRHPRCRYATSPKTRRGFWQAKFACNVVRDRIVRRQLRRMDWKVLTVWQCELKKPDRLTIRLNEFLSN